MIKTTEIAGWKCHLFIQNPDAPYVYWGMQMHGTEDVQQLVSLVNGMTGNQPYNLIVFESQNWNDDFSPWKALAVFGNEDFAGKAHRTYQWLTESCIPYIEADNPSEKQRIRLVAGYSLAGLFSLWAFLQKDFLGRDVFLGAASCSGSLWYPGWIEFLKEKEMPKESFVYLSLGDKEERTRNRQMAAVGEATRRTAEILQSHPKVKDCVLEWNPGGHFKNPLERTAKGISWLLKKF